jgi:two-component system chemotaxis sensor kinase CheA
MSDSGVPVADAVDPKILLGVLAQVKSGDFTARMPLEWTGVAGKVAEGLNDVIISNQALEMELARVSEVVGQQGKLSQRAVLGGWTQSWSGAVGSVNSLIEALRSQHAELRECNEGLERQASLLTEWNREAADRNQEIEQSKRLFEEKAAQLAISSKYKSEFIANMSHELRTPLNSLLILAQQLEDNPDHNMTDTQVQYASVISASGKELMGLLNSILDLAKVESGTTVADLTEFPLGELHRRLLGEFELVARGKGLAYSIDLAPDSPEDIVTDPRCLRQILKNLLANAFKFTEHGEVRVQIGLTDDGWSGETDSLVTASSVLAISVSDTGIGIDDEQQQRIFEAFAQGDGTTARLYGGTGLGLSISRQLAGLLGGEITVASSLGQGSTFTVYLPIGRPVAMTTDAANVMPSARRPGPFAASDESATEHASPRPDRRWANELENSAIDGMKILLVDDDYRNIFALSALLERGRADVIVAESGSEALAALETTPHVDVVLMDILMPVMDGYQAMRAIRAFHQFKNLPIIAVTGKAAVGERHRCIEAGANDYVPKPVDTAELLASLRLWVSLPARSATA